MNAEIALYEPENRIERIRKAKPQVDLASEPDLLETLTEPRTRVTKPGQPKFSPWEERQLIRDICEMTSSEIFAKWNITRSYLQSFKERRQREIDALLQSSDDAYAGLWIAQKESRVAALQDRYERLGTGAEATRSAVALMHEIADQLGQLPSKSGPSISTGVVNIYKGITQEELDSL